MPAYIYQSPEAVSVTINDFLLPYGFKTKLKEADRAPFGHVAWTGATLAVFGANAPRPPRAKDLLNGIVSYYDKDVDLAGEGLLKIRNGVDTPDSYESTKSQLMEVDFYGTSYVWYQPKYQLPKLEGKEALGVKPYNGINGVFGLSRLAGGVTGKNGYRKPATASFTTFLGTDGIDIARTFVTTPFTADPPAGWSVKNRKGS